MKFAKGTSCAASILIISFPMVFPSLNEKETAIVSDLVKEMDIRFCIFWDEDKDIYQTKRLSLESVMASQLGNLQFGNYFFNKPIEHENGQVHQSEDFSTAIIFKTKSLHIFEEVTAALHRAFQSFRLSWFTWFLFLNNSKPNIDHYGKRIPFNCEFIVIQEVQDNLYKLTEVYEVKNKAFSFDFGTWYNGVLNISNTTSYWRRLNLNRTIVTTFGFSEKQNACKQPSDEYCQTEILLYDLSKMMNFRIMKIVVPKILISHNYKEIMLSLMLNMNRKRDIDIIINIQNFYRNGFTEIFRLGPIFTFKYNWYIKYPEARLRQDFYLQPFVKDLWLSIFSILAIGCASTLLIRNLAKSNKLHLVDHFFLVFEIFCNQSGSGEVENISLRIICFAISITGIAVVNSFTSIITAFLAVKIPEIPFTNFDEFIENGQFKLALETQKTFMTTFLEETKYGNLTGNYTRMYNDSNYYKSNLGTILCNNENIAIYETNFEFEFENVSCRTYRIAEPITSGHLVLQLTFHNPFTTIFNHNLIRFREYGILKKMEDILHSQPIKNKEEENFTPIEFEQMIQVLSIPVIGMLLAAVIFACEFLCTRKKLWCATKRDKKTNPPVPLRPLFFKRSQTKQ